MQPIARPVIKAKEETASIRLSEIRSGSHFFFHVGGDEAAKVIEETMRIFTAEHGTNGVPCDPKAGKVVAALFNDGTGKSWYRAKILERKASQAKVLFLDHGNVANVQIATHLRPLEMTLGTDRIPAVAKEAILAGVKTRGLDDDDGIDAARLLQAAAWGKDVNSRIFCQNDGCFVVSLYEPGNATSVNEQMVSEGLARVSKSKEIEGLCAKMINSDNLQALASDLQAAENYARKSHRGMWRYGDVGDEDDDDEY